MPDMETHTTRGRRNPEIAAALLEGDGDESLDDYNEGQGDQSFYGLVEGDTLVAKVAFNGETALGEAWTTFGATTRQLPGETTEDALLRLRDVVLGGATNLGEGLVDEINEIRAKALETQRSHRIVPRSQQQ